MLERMVFTDVLKIQSSIECPVEASAGSSDVPFAQSSFSIYPQVEQWPKGDFHCWLPSLLFLANPVIYSSPVNICGWGRNLERDFWWVVAKIIDKKWTLLAGLTSNNLNWPPRGERGTQGSAYLKHLWVPSHWTWSASSEQARMKQVHGLESHWGLSAKASSTQASLAPLPHQVSNLWQTAEAWIGPIEKITARARPLHFMGTRMCASAQPIPWEDRHWWAFKANSCTWQDIYLITCLLMLIF